MRIRIRGLFTKIKKPGGAACSKKQFLLEQAEKMADDEMDLSAFKKKKKAKKPTLKLDDDGDAPVESLLCEFLYLSTINY